MKNKNSSGITTMGLLGVVFVAFKLTGAIDWSWWWVTCPFWGGIATGTIAFILIMFFEPKKSKQEPTKRDLPRSKFAERLALAQKEQERKQRISN